MKDRFKHFYMGLALDCAAMSSAVKLKVGAIIVKDHRIISHSWNGTPSGWSNTCEDDNGMTLPEVAHAEENSISKLARCHDSAVGSTVFITHSPCFVCSRLLFNAGVVKVYYRTHYRDTTGIDFLRKCGVEVEQLSDLEESQAA